MSSMAAPQHHQHDIRDRTSEFFATVQLLQKQQKLQAPLTKSTSSQNTRDGSNNSSSNGHLAHSQSVVGRSSTASGSNRPTSDIQNTLSAPLNNSSGTYARSSQFTAAAFTISTRITAITVMLQQLATLAKQSKSLFLDYNTDLNTLTMSIKEEIQLTQREIEALQEFVVSQKGLGGYNSSNSSSVVTVGASTVQHSAAIVGELRSKLADTTKVFSSVLKQRTDNMKAQNTRRKQFDNTDGDGSSSNSNGSSSSSSAPLRLATQRRRPGNAFDSLVNNNDSESQSLLDGDQQQLMAVPQQQQQQQQQQQDQNNAYLQSRAQAVESIESTITQLGAMYSQLIELVGQQEEIVLRIDTQLDDTLVNVEMGHSELLKYFDSVSGSRWLIFKVFGVLMAFVIFFMLFVA